MEKERETRQQFVGLSLLLTAITGQTVTAAQLLGEKEPAERSSRQQMSEGERRMRQILRTHERQKNRKDKEQPCPPES